MAAYVPARGDIVWLTFTPQAGHEQAGRRPAIVLSPEAYNRRVGLAIFCLITNQRKGYPFEVAIPDDLGVTGVILADQVKSLDWRSQNAVFVATVPAFVIGDVLQKLNTLVSLDSV